MSQGRRFHSDSRLSENFTEQGLQSLTGENQRYWARYVVKELLDNSLEAAEGYADAPEIDLTLEIDGGSYRSYVSKVVVEDNGPGISEDDMAAIFEDVSSFAGSKRHYCLPTRGNQGNALMTILGIQYLCGGPLVVETDGTRHVIQAMQDATDEWQIERDTEPTTVDGTRIVVDFSEDYYCRANTVDPTIGAFVALNPHVRWDVDFGAHDPVFEPATDATVERFSPRGSATTGKALWFSFDDFHERLKADARADQSLTVEEVVTEFAKLTSNSKANAVFDGIEEYRHQRIEKFLQEHSDGAIRTLYDAMVSETTTYSERGLDSTLGCVGSDLTHSLHNYLRFIGQYSDAKSLAERLSEYDDSISEPSDITLYYADGDVVQPENSEKTVPFYFEFAAIPKADEGSYTDIEFGINQSVAYSTPNVSVEFTANGVSYSNTSIKSAFKEATDNPYHIVTNLMCPNIDFEDKGKQKFDTKPFEDTISGVLKTAVGKIGRDIRPRLNDLRTSDEPAKKRELEGKAPKGFIKDVIYDIFEPIYNRETENGQFTITMRQMYYNVRPKFTEIAERKGYKYKSGATVDNPEPLELDSDYFRELVSQYEKEVLGKRVIHRDDRGFFVEPHSNQHVDLETVDVEKYEPDLDKFDTLLFVEKTGFFKQIHKDFELTKKYDIGLINGKGYSTIAGRNLVEKVKQRGDVELYTLTDLDIHGIGIADDVKESDDLSLMDEFDAKRLGITLDDIEEYDLTVESRNYNKKTIASLENKVDEGIISPEVAEFLMRDGGQGVEINALGTKQLRSYLLDKFEQEGIDKVIPDKEDIEVPEVPEVDEVRQEAVNEGIGEFVREQAERKLQDNTTWDDRLPETEATEKFEDAETDKNAIKQKVMEELDEWPTENWEDRNDKVVDDIEYEVREAKEQAKSEWKEAVLSHLQENVTIEVKIDE